jgi:EpsI family protein
VAVRSLVLIIILIVTGFYVRDLEGKRSYTRQIPDLVTLPKALEGWYGEDFPLTESVALVLDADVTLQRRYRSTAGNEVWLFIAYFAEQAVNSQIHSPRHCVPGSGWDIVSTEQTNIDLGLGPQFATQMFLQREGLTQEMLYWFRTRGGGVTGEYALKLDLLKNSLARRPTDAAFIRYSSLTRDSEAMRSLMVALAPHIQGTMSGVGL